MTVGQADEGVSGALGQSQPREGFLRRMQLAFLADPDAAAVVAGTRGKLLVAAVKLFASRGYDACSMRDLAKAVGLGAPALYNYYSSKTDILVAAVDYTLSDFYVAVLGNHKANEPRELLFEILRRHAIYGTSHRTMAKACDSILNPDFMKRVMPERDRRRVVQAMQEYIAILAELLEQVVGSSGDVDPIVRARSVHAIVDRASAWYEPSCGLTSAQVADQCCALINDMITPSRSVQTTSKSRRATAKAVAA